MKIEIKATIEYHIKNSHPDIQYIKNKNKKQSYTDTYTVDTDNFFNEEQYINHIKRDLMLVASGGYDTTHIENIKFDIKQL